MISSEEYVRETQQLLEENLRAYDDKLAVEPDESQIETFFRMDPDQQRKVLLHMVSESTPLMTIIDRLSGVDIEMAMLVEGHTLRELGRSFFTQVICELRAQQHYQQALLEVFNAVVADVERHDDGTLCIHSLEPFTVSDIAQMIIDSFGAETDVCTCTVTTNDEDNSATIDPTGCTYSGHLDPPADFFEHTDDHIADV